MNNGSDDGVKTRSRTGTRAFVFSFAGFGLLLLVGAFLGLRGGAGQALFGNAGFVKSITDDHGTYYRLKVKLTYWGVPEDFDIVVGCNVHIINYKGGGGSTYEVGLVPTVFGRRMYDGKALVVRPPSACRGETTANGQVQPDLLPLIVVYDNADTLDFGVAYLSDDAYASPLSVLTFGGATIEKATRAEFDEFRRTQTNVVTRELYHSTMGDAQQLGLTKVSGRFAYACDAYGRFLIPEKARSVVQKYWPVDHPVYWQATYDGEHEILKQLMARGDRVQTDRPGDTPHPVLAYVPGIDEPADIGLPTQGGGGLVLAKRTGVSRSYYPAANDYRLDEWPKDRGDWPHYVESHGDFAGVDLDFRNGEYRGFGYCSVRAGTSFALGNSPADSAIQKLEMGKRIAGRVDGQMVVSPRTDSGPGSMPGYIIERDHSVFQFFEIYLGGPRGDV